MAKNNGKRNISGIGGEDDGVPYYLERPESGVETGDTWTPDIQDDGSPVTPLRPKARTAPKAPSNVQTMTEQQAMAGLNLNIMAFLDKPILGIQLKWLLIFGGLYFFVFRGRSRD